MSQNSQNQSEKAEAFFKESLVDENAASKHPHKSLRNSLRGLRIANFNRGAMPLHFFFAPSSRET
jgi:hypothetical protein